MYQFILNSPSLPVNIDNMLKSPRLLVQIFCSEPLVCQYRYSARNPSPINIDLLFGISRRPSTQGDLPESPKCQRVKIYFVYCPNQLWILVSEQIALSRVSDLIRTQIQGLFREVYLGSGSQNTNFESIKYADMLPVLEK